ncbi:uncharacterized protein LOC106082896 [Stomoxys calcitrans]|uniref:uncharacterized protein LOC106082896 n=1 Tax=Stomoxys calcitrans TaxID=35570 RepID=UPI0027E353CC|nr:uncharacterized protein LOC106082896 [Stomoxys calcitrans]
MSKLSALLTICVLHAMANKKLTHAAAMPYTRNVAIDFMDTLHKLRHTLLCTTNSCDPNAALQYFAINEGALLDIQEKTEFPETTEFLAKKVGTAASGALSRLWPRNQIALTLTTLAPLPHST